MACLNMWPQLPGLNKKYSVYQERGAYMKIYKSFLFFNSCETTPAKLKTQSFIICRIYEDTAMLTLHTLWNTDPVKLNQNTN